jgi:hypothetical protein
MAETENRRSDDNRQLERRNLLLMADLRLAGEPGEHRVAVRNLSGGGMMAEGSVKAIPGTLVEVAIPELGWVAGAVAWVQDNRFGIAFGQDIGGALPGEADRERPSC